MDYEILVAEIENDPEALGITAILAGGLSESEKNTAIAALLNAVDRVHDLETVTGQQIFEAIVPAELNALTIDQKTVLFGIIGMGTIRINGTNTRAALAGMFSAGPTRTALQALQTDTISRAIELGLGVVTDGHVHSARLRIGA